MKKTGPSITHLTHRLGLCPQEFTEQPRIADGPGVAVDAVVGDLFLTWGAPLMRAKQLSFFRASCEESRDVLRLVLVAAWLLYDEELQTTIGDPRGAAELVMLWMEEDLPALAAVVKPEKFISEPERREELSRRVLALLEMIPEGETEKAAADRLKRVDSLERQRMLAETKERVRRAEELRKKMEEKRAREAAARWNRE